MKQISRSEAKKAWREMPKDLPLEWMNRAQIMGLYYERARNADIRLLKLEALSKKDGYNEILSWSYARAVKDIQHAFGDTSGNRFDRSVANKSTVTIKALLKDIEAFRSAPTSTKGKIDKIYGKAASTINKKYGANISRSEMGDFFESSKWKKLSSKYGSETAIKLIAKIQNSDEELFNQLKAENFIMHQNTRAHVADLEVAQRIADRLSKNGLSVDVRALIDK